MHSDERRGPNGGAGGWRPLDPNLALVACFVAPRLVPGAAAMAPRRERAAPVERRTRRTACFSVACVLVLLAGCRLQIESDRADARAIAARAERAAERLARQSGVPLAQVDVLVDVTAEMLDRESDDALADLLAGHEVTWSGLRDADADGIDDDRAIELTVDDVHVCLTFGDERAVVDGPC